MRIKPKTGNCVHFYFVLMLKFENPCNQAINWFECLLPIFWLESFKLLNFWHRDCFENLVCLLGACLRIWPFVERNTKDVLLKLSISSKITLQQTQLLQYSFTSLRSKLLVLRSHAIFFIGFLFNLVVVHARNRIRMTNHTLSRLILSVGVCLSRSHLRIIIRSCLSAIDLHHGCSHCFLWVHCISWTIILILTLYAFSEGKRFSSKLGRYFKLIVSITGLVAGVSLMIKHRDNVFLSYCCSETSIDWLLLLCLLGKLLLNLKRVVTVFN